MPSVGGIPDGVQIMNTKGDVMTDEKRTTSLDNVSEMLRNLSPEDREGLIQMARDAQGRPEEDLYPGYVPDCVQHDEIEYLYEHLVHEAMQLIHAREYAATGTIWSMLETLSLIIADANGMTAKIRDLNDMINERDEQLFEAHQRRDTDD